MTTSQRQLVLSWAVAVTIFALVLISVANDNRVYLVVGLLGGALHRYLRKNIDTEEFRPFREMGPVEQSIALLWYVLIAIAVILIVVKNPKAISYSDFRQFLLLLCILFVPLIPITLRREASLFHRAGKHET